MPRKQNPQRPSIIYFLRQESKTISTEKSFIMDIVLLTQIFGWAASICAVISYTFKNTRNIRIVNCVAAAFFIAYGFLLGAPAVIVMNATLAAVHIAYLVSHGKFGDIVRNHPKMLAVIFIVYAISCIAWVCVSTNMNMTEIVGIISSVGFVGGFMLPKERPMRCVCSAALIINIAYAFMLASPQIAITNSVSLVVNIIRLVQAHAEKNMKNAGVAPMLVNPNSKLLVMENELQECDEN